MAIETLREIIEADLKTAQDKLKERKKIGLAATTVTALATGSMMLLNGPVGSPQHLVSSTFALMTLTAGIYSSVKVVKESMSEIKTLEKLGEGDLETLELIKQQVAEHLKK